MKMKVATNNPNKLIEDIIESIASNSIRSWRNKNNFFYHKGEQYVNHIYFSYSINDDKGIIEFEMHSDGDSFATSRGLQLLESMLTRHFSNRIEIIKNN